MGQTNSRVVPLTNLDSDACSVELQALREAVEGGDAARTERLIVRLLAAVQTARDVNKLPTALCGTIAATYAQLMALNDDTLASAPRFRWYQVFAKRRYRRHQRAAVTIHQLLCTFGKGLEGDRPSIEALTLPTLAWWQKMANSLCWIWGWQPYPEHTPCFNQWQKASVEQIESQRLELSRKTSDKGPTGSLVGELDEGTIDPRLKELKALLQQHDVLPQGPEKSSVETQAQQLTKALWDDFEPSNLESATSQLTAWLQTIRECNIQTIPETSCAELIHEAAKCQRECQSWLAHIESWNTFVDMTSGQIENQAAVKREYSRRVTIIADCKRVLEQVHQALKPDEMGCQALVYARLSLEHQRCVEILGAAHASTQDLSETLTEERIEQARAQVGELKQNIDAMKASEAAWEEKGRAGWELVEALSDLPKRAISRASSTRTVQSMVTTSSLGMGASLGVPGFADHAPTSSKKDGSLQAPMSPKK